MWERDLQSLIADQRGAAPQKNTEGMTFDMPSVPFLLRIPYETVLSLLFRRFREQRVIHPLVHITFVH